MQHINMRENIFNDIPFEIEYVAHGVRLYFATRAKEIYND